MPPIQKVLKQMFSMPLNSKNIGTDCPDALNWKNSK